MADREASGDGRRGATDLARLLRPKATGVRVLMPAGAKDLRERLIVGGRAPIVFAAALGC